MKTLQVLETCTLLQITEGENSSAPLTEQAERVLAASPVLILSMPGILLNSMMIGELLNLHRRFAELWEGRSHRIALCNLTETSRMAMQRVRLDRIFPIYPTVDEAVSAKRNPLEGLASSG